VGRHNVREALRLTPFLVTLAIGASPAAGQASTASATIAVSATVLSFCTVSAAALAFGNYQSAVVNATTTVTATCTTGTTYNVGLDAGGGTGATVAARKMSLAGGNTLTYSLYQDSGHATVWGTTIGTNTVTGTGTGIAQPLTVYGQIPGAQYSAPGSYTDTVNVTLTY
jgi:spore coat protein U-like protein